MGPFEGGADGRSCPLRLSEKCPVRPADFNGIQVRGQCFLRELPLLMKPIFIFICKIQARPKWDGCFPRPPVCRDGRTVLEEREQEGPEQRTRCTGRGAQAVTPRCRGKV